MNVRAEDRFDKHLLKDFHLEGLFVIHEEIDVIDDVTFKRRFPTLFKWENFNLTLHEQFWRGLMKFSSDADVTFYPVSTTRLIGASSPQTPAPHNAFHVRLHGDAFAILLTCEVVNQKLYERLRDDARPWNHDGPDGTREYWYPSHDIHDCRPSDYDLVIGKRLFVLASPGACVDTMATMARMSL